MSDHGASLTQRAAATALGLDPGAGVEAARSAFLRRVGDVGFVPSSLVRGAAAESGVIPRGPEGRAALDAEAERMQAASIDEFADSYWELSPSDRRVRWEALSGGSERYPRVRRRLDELAGGLDVVPPTNIGDEARAQLVDVLVELYPMKPAARARRRAELIPRIGMPAEVRRVAESVRRIFPALKRIDHGLLEGLTRSGPPSVLLRTRRERRPEPADEPVRSSGGSRNWLWIIIPICIVTISSLGRVARNSSDRDTASSRYSTPQFTVPPAGSPTPWPGQVTVPSRPPARLSGTGISGPQLEVLRGLAKRQDLNPAEAAHEASVFIELGYLGPSFDRMKGKGAGTASGTDPSFTPEQQRIQSLLGRERGLSREQVKQLLIDFVKAGRAKAGEPPRP